METTLPLFRAHRLVIALLFWLFCLTPNIFSQVPTVTTRFANPDYDCKTDEYCLDVEFQSDAEDVELFGMNVRFFYDDAFMELIGFSDFQGGYGTVMPDPPNIMMTLPGAGTTFFGFPLPGVADFVNGAIQLVDNSQPEILISTSDWTKLFQVCFRVEGPIADSSNFCPPVIWDLEANPAFGGYLPGDDGVVITIVSPPPSMSAPAIENVVQFNWDYSGPGTPPFGAPRPTQCVSILCPVDLSLTKTIVGDPNGYAPGDNVDFTIEVTNEGDITIGEIHVIDYIPLWFTLNDLDWTPGNSGSTGQSASIVLSTANTALPAGGLLPGESVSVTITLAIDIDIPSGEYLNYSEIFFVLDSNGDDVSGNDIDSDPDQDDLNDPEAEDDHDGAVVCFLAPPVIEGERFVCPNDIAIYRVVPFDPLHTYEFLLLDGGGMIIETTDSSVTILWSDVPGGPHQISLTETTPLGCRETSIIAVRIEGTGPLACITQTNISIDNGCGTVVLSGMILTGEMEGNNTFEVFVIDMNGDTVPNATLSWEHVGQTFKVSVQSRCNGQSCWGYITVEDKLGPIINCVCPRGGEGRRCDITCLQLEEFLNGDIPDGLRPQVLDNCGGTTLDIVNIDLNFDPCQGGYVRVKWLATDGSGNTSTCEQEFNVVPLTLATLTFPDDYYGECGDESDPALTGWPQINGIDITTFPGHCNIITTYDDRVIQHCGGGTKIVRTWRVSDWCTSERPQRVQMIHLGDHTGPQITCPSDIVVSTNYSSCTANVILTRPDAVDGCSDIFSYKLVTFGGVIFPQGNNYVIPQLPIGTHTATWTVTDECYNTSTCSFTITVVDNTPPTVICHLHTVVSLTDDRQNGLTLIPADVFSDGSFDDCGPVSYRAKRMDSCLEFDWTTEGACIDEIPGGIPPITSRDHGTVFRPCVPFANCDVGRPGGLMVQLEVTDASGNVNYCMINVEVQDKLPPNLTCPPDIIVSCAYPFDVQEGTFRDLDGNQNGTVDEDPLSQLFGNMYDGFRYTPGDRNPIIINDPNNPNVTHPYNWGLDGWATDNSELELSVEVREYVDCSGSSFSGNPPVGAVKLIERVFTGRDRTQERSCVQRIWIVDHQQFYINDVNCNDEDPFDGIIWPCNVLLNNCPEDLGDTGEPIVLGDGCSMVAVTHKDTRYNFVDNVCFKILREWIVMDWCQFDPNTGRGMWTYTQEIKVADSDGVVFLDAPASPVAYCLNDPGISLPGNNQIFIGENNPASSSCSVHVDLGLNIYDVCSGAVHYDVKVYPFNGSDFLQLVPVTLVALDSNSEAIIRFNTENSNIPSISENGLPYTSAQCEEYHRVLWTLEDGCGNRTYADYLFRLEDCKAPSPVCIDGVSTAFMQPNGEVTVNASSFNASSVDDCTPGNELLFSFSGDSYQPTHTYTCDDVPVFGVEFDVDIWVADGGVDHNCNGQIEWSERNKIFCTASLLISDLDDVCENEGGILEGEIISVLTDAVSNVTINLTSSGNLFPQVITANDGKFKFNHIPSGQEYMITPRRNDNHRNGVSTLDLVQIQKHLLGTETFSSPYQYIAADANNSQSVSAIDLIEIRKVILGIQDEFTNNESWRFVTKGTDMSEGNPWPFSEYISIASIGETTISAMDFVGVKIGDVNNTVQANANQLLPRSGNHLLKVKATGKGQITEGEEVEVKFDFAEVLEGFQWTLETEGLEFLDVVSDDIIINKQNTGKPADDILTMSWNGELLKAGSAQTGFAITLKFKATQSGRLMDMLSMSGKVTTAEAYMLDGEVREVSLTFNSAGIFAEFDLFQNKPNPWTNQTIIGFHLPEDAPAQLTVFDLNGKVVKTISDNFKAGYNAVTLSTGDVPASGVYYYRLESGGYVASKKMVTVK